MKWFSLLVTLLVLVLVKTSAKSQDVFEDEVLITIAGADCPAAQSVVPSPLRVYQRLGELYLAGTSRASLGVLRKRGVEAVIVDDRPWTSSYAVVARPPRAQLEPALDVVGLPVVYRGDDFRIVKGDATAFQRLREQGFTCVEIERIEIPCDATTTRLPDGIGHHDSGIIDSLVAMVSDTSIRNSIQAMQNFGTRYWNNANRDTVARWLRARYVQAGVGDARLDSFQYSSTWQTNVVATIRGAVDSTRELIVGGHHDATSSNTLQAPGADDNATGASAAWEMARVLKLANYQPAYTMRFMGYAAEEAGLRGSASYAQRARTANRDIRAMLNYDMIGNRTQSSPDRDVYMVWYTGSEALSNLHTAIARAYTTLTPVLTTSYRSGSDSYSFWQQNYKAVFLIERDFSPYYHSPNDLLQYLDMQYCREIVQSGLATLLTLDQMPPNVANLQVRDRGNGNSLYVSWDSVAVPDWASYKVYVGGSAVSYDTSYLQTTRTRTITGLIPSKRYYIGVSIVDIVGREGMITQLSAVPRTQPQPPVGLVSTSLPGSVKLNWRRNGEMDLRGYIVFRKPLASGTFESITPTPIADTTLIDIQTSGTYLYFVNAVDSTGNISASSDTVQGTPITGVGETTSPFEFRLFQNYPNPFNPSTQIKYEVAHRDNVELNVCDVLGRNVATLVHEVKSPGTYVAYWNASNMSSGVYYIQLRAEGRVATQRAMLVK
ncbi:MAG: M20/M25/M40 family metallo-hydrolase [Ignavibacteriae bacterium]|nr:M20/M25/M40 family metallo-hydrolase [Ignavibacteriota bacterium]